MRKNRPVLFACLGYPGSGKTHFAQELAKRSNVFHLSTDRLHLEIFPKAKYTKKEQIVKFRVMNYITEELLKRGVSVVYDADSSQRVYRQELKGMANKYRADYLLLWFKTPLEIALKRIKSRRDQDNRYYKVLDESVVYDHIKVEEEPLDEEYVIIDGTKTFEEQFNSIEKYFK